MRPVSGSHKFTARTAMSILVVLSAINFVNYLDRYVLSAVLVPLSDELGIGDVQGGLLGTAFMVVYMVAAPLGGYLGDRGSRKILVAGGVALWSLATIGSGFADDYSSLLMMRALIGIGEAGYATVAPTIIADLFAPKRRGRMLSYFYLAIPMGSALGYLLGGWVGEHYGWRAAFWVAGGPGLLLAVAAAMLPEPKRGGLDEEEPVKPERLSPVQTGRRLLDSPAWVINTIGTTLMTFSMGGLAFWMPTFLVRAHGLSLSSASIQFGGVTVVAGLVGTLLGGHLGDKAQAKGQGGYLRVSGWGLLLGAPFAFLMPLMPTANMVFVAAFFAELLLFLNTGPLNAALVACMPPTLRASAFALNVFMIHAFGDAFSPTLMGWISEQSHLGIAVAFTGVPIAIGGVVLLRGATSIEKLPRGLRAVRSDY
jgi:MFS family permease